MFQPLLALLCTLCLASCLSNDLGSRDLKLELRNNGSDRIKRIFVAVGTAEQFEEELGGVELDEDSAIGLFLEENAPNLPYAQEFAVPAAFESKRLAFDKRTNHSPKYGITERLIKSGNRLKSCVLITIPKEWVRTNKDTAELQAAVLAWIGKDSKLLVLDESFFATRRHAKIRISEGILVEE